MASYVDPSHVANTQNIARRPRVGAPGWPLLVLWVGAGGVVGTMMRYLVVTWVNSAMGGAAFPYGTLAVNALGCLVIGLVVGFWNAHHPLTPEAQAFLIVGVLGGFTTFSAFGIDTVRLLRDGAYLAGFANVILQLGIGLSAVAVGLRIAQAFRPDV